MEQLQYEVAADGPLTAPRAADRHVTGTQYFTSIELGPIRISHDVSIRTKADNETCKLSSSRQTNVGAEPGGMQPGLNVKCDGTRSKETWLKEPPRSGLCKYQVRHDYCPASAVPEANFHIAVVLYLRAYVDSGRDANWTACKHEQLALKSVLGRSHGSAARLSVMPSEADRRDHREKVLSFVLHIGRMGSVP